MPHMKIYGEHTRLDGQSLCVTCKNSAIMKGTSFKDDKTICHAGFGRITCIVTECSHYDDNKLTGLGALNDIAWLMYGKTFYSPQQRYRLREVDETELTSQPTNQVSWVPGQNN
jgi:hypothetical protein